MLATMVLGMTLVLIVFGMIVYTLIRNHLLTQLQGSLLATARMVGGLVERDDEGVELEVALDQLPEFSSTAHPRYYRIWDANGGIIAKSERLHSQTLSFAPVSPDAPDFEFRRVEGIQSLCIAISFVPRTEGDGDRSGEDAPTASGYHLAVSQDARRYFAELGFLRGLIWLASLAAILLSVLVARAVVWRTLRPVQVLAGDIAAISTTDLQVQVSDQQVPQELMPMVDRLNDLLSRLEASFRRERQFTADVAHELRTPLAGLRSTLEVTLSRDRQSEQYQAAMAKCVQIANSMQTMVENLLTLTRINESSIKIRSQSFELVPLVERCWSGFAREAQGRGLTFTCQINATLRLKSDPDYLAMVLTNLIGNAVAYTNPGGRIVVTSEPDRGCLTFSIKNTGCGLPPGQVEHVFDPFWRADKARTATGLHCGLGLSLVRRIIEILGADIHAEVADGEFAVHITGLKGP